MTNDIWSRNSRKRVALSYKTHKVIVEEKLQMISHELFSNLKQRWSFYKPSPSLCLVKVFSVPCTAVCACVSAVQVCMDVCVFVLLSWNELEGCALMRVIFPPLFVILALSLLLNIVIIKIGSEIEKKSAQFQYGCCCSLEDDWFQRPCDLL